MITRIHSLESISGKVIKRIGEHRLGKGRDDDKDHTFFYDTFYQEDRGKLESQGSKSLKLENRVKEEHSFAP